MEGIMKRLTVADFAKVIANTDQSFDRKIVAAIKRMNGRIEYYHINMITDGISPIILHGSYEDMDAVNEII